MTAAYNANQQAWLHNMDTWLAQVAAVDPTYAHSAGVKQALGAQAKTLGIDPADIQDPPENSHPNAAPPQSGPPAPPTGSPVPSAKPGTAPEHPGTDSSSPATAPGKFSAPNTGPVDENGFSIEPPKGEMPPEERARFAVKLAKHLQEKYGLTDNQVAGIMGNLMIEGRFSPNMREGGQTFGGAPIDLGMGIVQWTGLAPGARGYNFVEFCKSQQPPLDINSESANVKFLDYELTHPGQGFGVMAKFKENPNMSVKDATENWLLNFEFAANPHQPQREKCANNWVAFTAGSKTAFMNNLIGMDG